MENNNANVRNDSQFTNAADIRDITRVRLQRLIEFFSTRHDKCYIDADSLINGSQVFFDRIYSILPAIQAKKYGLDNPVDKVFNTTASCAREVVKISECTNGFYPPDQVERAKRAVNRIKKLNALGVFTVKKDNSQDAQGDQTFIAVAANAGKNLKIGFITQDRALASALHRLKEETCSTFHHSINRIDRYGFLGRNDGNSVVPVPAASGVPTGEVGTKRGQGSIRSFSCDGIVPAEPDEELPSGAGLDIGDRVQTIDGSDVVLGEDISSGSEAVVFEVKGDPAKCVKIFRSPTRRKERKVGLLCSRDFNIPGVVFPDTPVYSNGHFVGYIMDMVPHSVALEAVFSDAGKRIYCREWDRRQFALLALRISQLFYKIHTKGILAADVSGTNIRIALDENNNADIEHGLYMIDLDSCQVGFNKTVFPPDGVTTEYLAPELQEIVASLGGWPRDMIMSYKAELFSVTLLCGRCAMCGLHLFRAVNTTEDDIALEDHIARREFPYGVGDVRRNGDAPGLGMYLWSNLPSGLKKILHASLTADPENRIPLRDFDNQDLMGQLQHYNDWLCDSENQQKFPEILSLLPSRLKPFMVVCDKCGMKFDATVEGVHNANGTLCKKCSEEKVSYCAECGTPTLTAGEKLQGRYAYKYCDACFDAVKSQFARYTVCTRCGRMHPRTRGQEISGEPCICRECSEAATAVPTSAADAAEAPERAPVSGRRGFFNGLKMRAAATLH